MTNDSQLTSGAAVRCSALVSQPHRVQLSRKKGWKLPPNTVVVSRPTRWGNPFVAGRDGSRVTCVGLYEKLMAGYLCLSVKATAAAQNEAHIHAAQHLSELRGKNLACWCPENSACHADVLLRLANDGTHRREAAAGDVEMQTHAESAASRSVQ